eukprot:TRINITY_DN3536_c0_g1_i3.p1 TRINITY_DN3536_c0_g1~~TRINITY_DN3536_c0_g1_i3.p1  ORF type:complete len:819 (-),score=229.36 TRINITY_DN3536_c0_g1_i3:118-2574(-)
MLPKTRSFYATSSTGDDINPYNGKDALKDQAVIQYREINSIEFDDSETIAEFADELYRTTDEVITAQDLDWDRAHIDDFVDAFSGDQHEFGVRFSFAERNLIMQTLRLMRERGTLTNLNQPRLVEEFCDSSVANEVRLEPRKDFVNVIHTLDDVLISTPSERELRYKFYDTGNEMLNLRKHLGEIRKMLVTPRHHYTSNANIVSMDVGALDPTSTTKLDSIYPIKMNQITVRFKIQLWHVDPRTLSTRASKHLRPKRYYAVSESTSGGNYLDVFIAHDHPNIVEAVVHAYFRWKGCTHEQCILLESLVSSNHKLADRMLHQIEVSSTLDLATVIQQTPAVIHEVEQNLEGQDQPWEIAELSQLARDIRSAATVQLINNHDRDLELYIQDVSGSQQPAEYGTSNLARLVTRAVSSAMWSDQDMAFLEMFLHELTKRSIQASCRHQFTELVYRIILKMNRYSGIRLLKDQVRDFVSYPLASVQSISASLESLGWNETTIAENFRQQKLTTMATTIYHQIRDELKHETEFSSSMQFDESKYFEDQKAFESYVAKSNRFSLGVLFSIPFFFDLLFSLLFGRGFLVHPLMPEEHRMIIELSIVLTTILMAPAATSVAKVCSQLMYRYAIRKANLFAAERQIAANVVLLMAALAVAITTSIVKTWDIALLAFVHIIVMGNVHMRLIALTTMDIDEFLLFGGHRFIVLGLIPLVSPPILVDLAVPSDWQSVLVTPIYVVMLTITAAYYHAAFRWMCHSRLRWFHSIVITPNEDIKQWFIRSQPESGSGTTFSFDMASEIRERSLLLGKARVNFAKAIKEYNCKHS